MTAEPLSRAAEPAGVDEAARALLLSHLGRGHGMAIACRMSGVDKDDARRFADAWGWPDKQAIRSRWLREMDSPVPAQRAPEPAAEPAPEPPAEPEPPEDHRAVERALALARAVRSRHHERVARLTGGWSQADLLEVALALASLLPAPLDPEVALAWLDLPAEEWPAETLAVEVGRWDAGARDATAEAARVERDRRGSCAGS